MEVCGRYYHRCRKLSRSKLLDGIFPLQQGTAEFPQSLASVMTVISTGYFRINHGTTLTDVTDFRIIYDGE